jgi:hypothetical protein
MRFERAYSQGNPIETQPVAAILVKTVENRKKTGNTCCTAKSYNLLINYGTTQLNRVEHNLPTLHSDLIRRIQFLRRHCFQESISQFMVEQSQFLKNNLNESHLAL